MVIRLRGRVLTGEADLPDGIVEIDNGVLTAIGPADADQNAAEAPPVVILPGLIDVHCHGGGGASFTAGDADQVRLAALHHLEHGTTGLVGSTVTDSPARMLTAVTALADGVDRGELLAVHCEGPFLASARCGAQDPTWLAAPDKGLARELLATGRGHLRIVTMAPELPGAREVAEVFAEGGARVAVGHTEADEAVTRAFLDGMTATVVTHLFNGMPPLHHRAPGPVGGALAAASTGHATLELIADGVHVADEIVRLMLGLLPGRIALVTDAMAAAGLTDGNYSLGPQTVRVEDGVARLAQTGVLAGGTARLLDLVRRQIAGGADPRTVIAAATAVPAEVLGLEKVSGSLRVGQRADLIVTDPSLQPLGVMRAGEWLRDAGRGSSRMTRLPATEQP